MFSDKLNQIAERYPLWTLLLVLRVPLIVVVGYALMVGDWLVEDVAFEAVRYVVLDRPDQLYLIAPLLLLAGFAIRFCGETMIDLVTPSLRRMGGLSGSIVWILPRLLAAQIGILTGAKFILVALNSNDFGPDNPTLVPFVPSDVNQPAALAGAVYILIGILVWALPTRWISSVGSGFAPLLRVWNTSAVTHATALALLVIAVGVFFLFADWTNPEPAQFVGTFGVIALWAFAAVLYFSPFALLAHLISKPVLLLLAITALLLSTFSSNDNHEFRTTENGDWYFLENLSLEEWLKARSNIDLYAYDHYPVFVVVAEGGGLRSAYFTNRVLRTLQAVCPAFALHTIAISGVSGGSVGAASFAAQAADKLIPDDLAQPCKLASPAAALQPQRYPQPIDDDLQQMYGEDHLAVLLGATLFPDALQRILPFQVPAFDRARAIECSFEQVLARTVAAPHSTCSDTSLRIGDLYVGKAAAVSPPNLFLNTTSVTNGAQVPVATRRLSYRRIKSPFAGKVATSVQALMNGVEQPALWRAPPKRQEKPNRTPRDLPLATAAFLSARFPFVLPPARFSLTSDNNDLVRGERLIDGGIFEASGTWFAEQVGRALSDEIDQKDKASRNASLKRTPGEIRFDNAMRGIRLYFIVIRATPCASKDQNAQAFAGAFTGECLEDTDVFPDQNLEGLAELGSPGRALLNARLARGNDAQGSLRAFTQELQGRARVAEIRFLNNQDVHIPLSWSMSRESRRQMDDAVAAIPHEYWPKMGFRRTIQPTRLSQPFAKQQPFRFVVCALHQRIDTPPDELGCPELLAGQPPTSPAEPPTPPTEEPERDPLPALPEVDRCEDCKPTKP